MDPTRRSIAGAAWLASGVSFLIAEAVSASRFTPGYNYAVNYISELGVPGCFTTGLGQHACSPLSGLMNASFIATGLLFGVALAAVLPRLSGWRRIAFLLAGAAHSIGIVVVGLFHGGGTAKENGTLALHGLGAILAIVGGNLAIAVSPIEAVTGAPAALTWWRRLAPVCGLLGLLVLAVSISGKLGLPPGEGAWERLSVYTITGWEILIGAWLLLPRGSFRTA